MRTSGAQEKNIKHSGNLELDEVIEIARVMRDRSCARKLAGTVKEILGTCVSVGCTVNHEDPRELQNKVSLCCDTACMCSCNDSQGFEGCSTAPWDNSMLTVKQCWAQIDEGELDIPEA